MKSSAILVILSVGILVGVFLIQELVIDTTEHYAVFEGTTFSLEIADSAKERQQGLMFRQELCEDCGMLFIFEETGVYSFWMKNTYIPLDIVYLDVNGVIVEILQAEPCTEELCEVYDPQVEALYVLEVIQGTFSQEDKGKQITLKL